MSQIHIEEKSHICIWNLQDRYVELSDEVYDLSPYAISNATVDVSTCRYARLPWRLTRRRNHRDSLEIPCQDDVFMSD